MTETPTAPARVCSEILIKIDVDDPTSFKASRLEVRQQEGRWRYNILQITVQIPCKDTWITNELISSRLDEAAKHADIDPVAGISFRAAINRAYLIQEEMVGYQDWQTFTCDKTRTGQLERFALKFRSHGSSADYPRVSPALPVDERSGSSHLRLVP
ncbi:MAG: hypothetical protein WCD70_10725 [Alphaproteobacteria bacterium]